MSHDPTPPVPPGGHRPGRGQARDDRGDLPVATINASHLYPGARLVIGRAEAPADAAGGAPPERFTIDFADGSTTTAEVLQGSSGDIAVRVATYETERGTSIPAKLWPVQLVERGDPDQVAIRLGRAMPVGNEQMPPGADDAP